MTEYFIGLMSGTSADGIDAVLVDCVNPRPSVIATHQHALPEKVRDHIFTFTQQPNSISFDQFGSLDNILGSLFAEAALLLLKKTTLKAEQISAIGSHGQTIYHQPDKQFSLQLANPHIIAERTGITTVADFRRRDIAAGGQGAPLAPLFHEKVFSSTDEPRVILNIGGIANITFLSKNRLDKVIGFDTGPGNALLDAWAFKHLKTRFDQEGQFALSGQIDKPLLDILMAETYFKQPPPKSTGKELFNLTWLQAKLKERKKGSALAPQDVQATLLDFTAQTIAQAILPQAEKDTSVYVCGGGVHNKALMFALAQKLYPHSVFSTDDLGLNPDYVEAVAFAWLAKMRLKNEALDVSALTGAKHPVVLGAIFA